MNSTNLDQNCVPYDPEIHLARKLKDAGFEHIQTEAQLFEVLTDHIISIERYTYLETSDILWQLKGRIENTHSFDVMGSKGGKIKEVLQQAFCVVNGIDWMTLYKQDDQSTD